MRNFSKLLMPLLLLSLCLSLSACNSQQQAKTTTNKDTTIYHRNDLDNGEVAVLKSNVIDGNYYCLYLYEDDNNTTNLCAKLAFSADDVTDGEESIVDFKEGSNLTPIHLKFKFDNDWSTYQSYLCGDGRIALVTSETAFTDQVFNCDTLYIECQVSDDENDKQVFKFDLSQIQPF